MAKECRKCGISLVVASQEARDFHVSVLSSIASYLVLRLTETDAKSLRTERRGLPARADADGRDQGDGKIQGAVLPRGHEPAVSRRPRFVSWREVSGSSFDTFVDMAPSFRDGTPRHVVVAFEAAVCHHRYHAAFTHPNGDERWSRPR